MANDILKIAEIFYSLQGESTFAGLPCIFVRLSGCNLQCAWCDTAYANDNPAEMSTDEVMEQISHWPCRLVEITGGEPLLQPAVHGLLAGLCGRGYEVLLETSGAEDISKVDPRVRRIMDIKCPGSGMSAHNRWSNLQHLTARDEVKMIIAGRADYEWARDLIRKEKLDQRCPVLMAPAYGLVSNPDLAQWILDDRLPVRYQLQLHKYIWPADWKGV